MKQDMDLIRSIVLDIENGKDWFETTSDETAAALGTDGSGLSQEEADRLEYHLTLLEASGIAEFPRPAQVGFLRASLGKVTTSQTAFGTMRSGARQRKALWPRRALPSICSCLSRRVI